MRQKILLTIFAGVLISGLGTFGIYRNMASAAKPVGNTTTEYNCKDASKIVVDKCGFVEVNMNIYDGDEVKLKAKGEKACRCFMRVNDLQVVTLSSFDESLCNIQNFYKMDKNDQQPKPKK